jgi:hypothetical protein
VGDVHDDHEPSEFDHQLHDGETAPQLGDVEAALIALKGSAVFDRDPQTVEVMELMMAKMAATNATITELRAELDEGHTVIMPPPSLLYIYYSGYRKSIRV